MQVLVQSSKWWVLGSLNCQRLLADRILLERKKFHHRESSQYSSILLAVDAPKADACRAGWARPVWTFLREKLASLHTRPIIIEALRWTSMTGLPTAEKRPVAFGLRWTMANLHAWLSPKTRHWLRLAARCASSRQQPNIHNVQIDTLGCSPFLYRRE